MADNPYDTRGVSAMQALMGGEQTYDRMRGYNKERETMAGRQEAARLLAGGDQQGAIARLMGMGDIQGAQVVSGMGNTKFDQDYKTQSLDLQRQAFNRREEPEDVRKLRSAGINPNSPEGRKALFPRTDTPVSATDKKVVIEAEDEIPQIKGTIENLNEALALNDKTFTGYTAGIRGDIGTKMPFGGLVVDKNAALATSGWQKIMGPEALKQMASTLKGATTDFELRKFIEMLGDPATDPSIRRDVIDRMKKLAERKLELQGARVTGLRSGDYFKPGGGPPAPAPQQGGGITKQQYDLLPSGSPYTAPDGSNRIKP